MIYAPQTTYDPRAHIAQAALAAAPSEAFEAQCINKARAVAAPASPLGDVWRHAIARIMGEYQGMNGIRKKAFGRSVEMASASIRLAAANLKEQGAPNAAAQVAQLATAIETHAAAMAEVGKNAPRKR